MVIIEQELELLSGASLRGRASSSSQTYQAPTHHEPTHDPLRGSSSSSRSSRHPRMTVTPSRHCARHYQHHNHHQSTQHSSSSLPHHQSHHHAGGGHHDHHHMSSASQRSSSSGSNSEWVVSAMSESSKNPFYGNSEHVLFPFPLVKAAKGSGLDCSIRELVVDWGGTQLDKLLRPAAYGLVDVGVYMRCWYVSTEKKELVEQFPRDTEIVLSHGPSTFQVYKEELRNRFRPLDITQFVKSCLAIPGSRYPVSMPIKIRQHRRQFQKPALQSFIISVFMGTPVSPEQRLSELQATAIPAELCELRVEAKLNERQDSEVMSVGGTYVTLTCPLSQSRMQYPCRGQDCGHLQCFDALFYLKMNFRKPAWQCPICRKKTPFDSLRLDELFTNILSAAPDDAVDVEFLENGKWKFRSHADTQSASRGGSGGGGGSSSQLPANNSNLKRRRTSDGGGASVPNTGGIRGGAQGQQQQQQHPGQQIPQPRIYLHPYGRPSSYEQQVLRDSPFVDFDLDLLLPNLPQHSAGNHHHSGGGSTMSARDEFAEILTGGGGSSTLNNEDPTSLLPAGTMDEPIYLD